MLTTGSRLGPYEILAPLGAGGMGEVWKARDTRLDRVVAIKTVNGPFSERFEREARAISALNHPHICTLHDVGEHEGAGYLVMELVEGALLAGPVPLERALTYASQICSALEAAHKKGIVHRDLKPANILVTKAGVKLLDFGLAKQEAGRAGATGRAGGEHTDGHPGTDARVTKMLTGAHVVVGTPQYMAPEQIEGHAVDARTDIFALGCVLYELLTGQKAFDGKSPSSVMAAILATEPRPLKELQPLTPPALERLIKRCLAKDPDDRWQSARDLRAEIEWIGGDGAMTPAPPTVILRSRAVPWAVVAVCAASALGLAVFAWTRSAAVPAQRPLSANVTTPSGVTLDTSCPPTLSPDGQLLVFNGRTTDGKTSLWLRRMDSGVSQPLVGTEGASYPFWSPDSRFVGFAVESTLKKVAVAGGPPVRIADLPAAIRGASWSPNGTVIVAANVNGPILRVPAIGGTLKPATTVEADRDRFGHRLPWFLPDGEHFLYLGFNPGDDDQSVIRVGVLDDPGFVKDTGVRTTHNPIYAGGYLLFVQDSTLMAQAFSTVRLATTGDLAPIAEEVRSTGSPRGAASMFSSSASGLLVYLSQPIEDLHSRLVWINRQGVSMSTFTERTSRMGDVELSPDDTSLIADAREGGNADLWLYDVSRAVSRKFTIDRSIDAGPRWAPDGHSIYWRSDRVDGGIYQKTLDGASIERKLFGRMPGGPVASVSDISPDGSILLLHTGGPYGATYTLPSAPDSGGLREASPFLVSQSLSQTNARFSPDGKWVAYVSFESSRSEIWLARYPDATGKTVVSNGGGAQPRWRADGRELFYVSRAGQLVAVDMTLRGDQLIVGQSHALFSGVIPNRGYAYDVTRDGQKFLVIQDDIVNVNVPPLTLVEHWTAALQK